MKKKLLSLPTLPKPTPKNMIYRHPVFVFVISLFLIANTLLALSLPMLVPAESLNDMTHLTARIPAVLSVANIICIVALLRWKKWGFYAIAAIGLVGFGVNLYTTHNLANASLGLLGIVILYIALQLGGKNKAWNKLI